METMSTGGDVASQRAVLEVASVEVPAEVLTAPRFPRPKPKLVREVPKPKKDKKKVVGISA